MLPDMVKNEKLNVVLVVVSQHFGCSHSFPSVSTKVPTLLDFTFESSEVFSSSRTWWKA